MEQEDSGRLPPAHRGGDTLVVNSEKADRAYADVLVEVCRQRTLINSEALDTRLK